MSVCIQQPQCSVPPLCCSPCTPLPQALGKGTKRFVLKNLAYDSVHRADLFTLPSPAGHLESYLARPDVIISQQQPWIVQEFIQVGVWRLLYVALAHM
jgi:hypothetical protein